MNENARALFGPPLDPGRERDATSGVNPPGFHLRPPPPAHERGAFVTPDDKLFETIHMGPAEVDASRWRLQVDGEVARPFSIDLQGLKSLPSKTVIAFHECWGSPLHPHTMNLLRVGNVSWTGVPLKLLLDHAEPLPETKFVWTEGLDSGEFGGKQMSCYRKDLPLAKALSDEVLVAYEMSGEPLRKERGGPVRLVVPAWFGTNMTKWLCRISAQSRRADSPFTTDWYNEEVTVGNTMVRKPVWEVAPNSMIVEPSDGATVSGDLRVRGWAWAADPISVVVVSTDGGKSWREAPVDPRREFEWQGFACSISAEELSEGSLSLMVRAYDTHGASQPLTSTRNACHIVGIHWQRAPAQRRR